MRVMLCNIGWSDKYEGALLRGAHDFIRKHKGDGSERWNFKQFRDGKVYGYIRGMGAEHSPPQLPRDLKQDWHVVFYAKDPSDQKLKVVGLYKRATIFSEWKDHPINRMIQAGKEKHACCAVVPAERAKLMPEDRRPPLGTGFGQAGFVYLTDPRTGRVKRKNQRIYKYVIGLLNGHIPKASVNKHLYQVSPITIDPEHRRLVERASMTFVKKQLRLEGYKVKDVSSIPCGHDFRATRGADVLYIEVKGTSGTIPRFILTKNELAFMEKDPSTRVAIVTSALARPRLHVVPGYEIGRIFRLRPMQFEAVALRNVKGIIANTHKFFDAL